MSSETIADNTRTIHYTTHYSHAHAHAQARARTRKHATQRERGGEGGGGGRGEAGREAGGDKERCITGQADENADGDYDPV